VILTAQPEGAIDPELVAVLESPIRVEVVEEIAVAEGEAE
jgi:hypothetical protein